MTLKLALQVNLSNPTTQVETVSSFLGNVTADLVEAPSDDKSVAVSSAKALSSLAQRLESETLSESNAQVIVQDLFQATASVVSTIGQVNCNGKESNTAICSPDQKQDVVSSIEETLFSLGPIASSRQTNDQSPKPVVLSSPQINMTASSAKSDDLAGSKIEAGDDVSIELPDSIGDIGGGDTVTLIIANIEQDLYSSPASQDVSSSASQDIKPAQNVLSVRLTNSKGEVLSVDDDDPLKLEIKAPEEPSSLVAVNDNETLAVDLPISDGAALVLTVDLGDTSLYTLKGRFDGSPRDDQYDFKVEVHNQLITQSWPDEMESFIKDNTTLKMRIYKLGSRGSKLLFKTRREETEKPFSRRRLLQSGFRGGVIVEFITPIAWSTECVCWVYSHQLQITGIDDTVKFSSNFFGSFSIDQAMVAPNTIDFDAIFDDFSQRLEDSPYVLALHCFLLAFTIIMVLFLRRLDRTDAKGMRYLPLVGNESSDEFHYAVSLTTSTDSSKTLDMWPCLILTGRYGRSPARLLIDGKRQNFGRGSTDNFILTTSGYLGDLLEIKIWITEKSLTKVDDMEFLNSDHYFTRTPDISNHLDNCNNMARDTCSKEETENICTESNSRSRNDTSRTNCCGEGIFSCFQKKTNETKKESNEDWKLDHIVVMDMSNKERYVFLSGDWLSRTKGSGKTVQNLPIMNTEKEDSGDLFGVVSKRKLYDEHLWLSVAKRPAYSIFTRVQRFLCAIAAVYLAMITNAMWYSTGEEDEEEDDQNSQDLSTQGIQIGTVRLTYRTFYVGVVSSLIILVPVFFMTWIFRKRRERTTKSSSVHPSSDQIKVRDPDTYADISIMSPLTPRTEPAINVTDFDTTACISQMTDHSDIDNQLPGDYLNFDLSERSLSTPFDFSVPSTPQSSMEKDRPSPTLLTTSSSSLQHLYTPIVSHRKLEPEYKSQNFLTSFHRNAKSCELPADEYSSVSYQDSVSTYDITCANNYIQKQKHDVTQQQLLKRRFSLPWWTIFIGYLVVFLSITSAAFFTFFYSLEWGGDVSLQWMASLFFSATAGTFLLEPLKILVISLLLSCLLRDSVHNELSEMPPVAVDYSSTTKDKSLSGFNLLPPEDDPGQDDEIQRRRTEHQLQKRLYSVIRGVTLQVVLATVVILIAFHGNINQSFQQNSLIKNNLGLSKAEEDVKKMDDIYKWSTTVFLPLAMPKHNYNHDLMSVYDQRFTSEQAYYRFTRVSLTQSRVKPNCSVLGSILDQLDVPLVCYFEYDEDTMEKRSFIQDWVPCNASSCLVAGFTYVPGDARSLPIEGSDTSYDPGGYQVLLEQDQNKARDSIQTLESTGWMNELTRAVVLEFSVFNPDTRLFTQAKVLFETPTYGSVLVKCVVRSARLYPYTDVWDYMILLCQIIFIIIVLVRLSVLIHLITCPKGRERFNPSTVAEIVDLSVSISAITTYSVRIAQTIDLVEFIRNSPGLFASLDTVIELNEGYNLCIGIVLFIRILRFLGPLAVNYYLYIMHVTLVTMRGFLLSLLATILVVLVAFSCFFYVLEGPVTHNVRTVLSAMTTLLTLLLGMTKYRSFKSSVTGFVQYQLHRGMYCLFGTVCTLILLNIAISMLNASLALIKNKEEKLEKQLKKKWGTSQVSGEEETAWKEGVRDDLDRQLGSYVWKKFLSLFFDTSKNEMEHAEPITSAKMGDVSERCHLNFNTKKTNSNISASNIVETSLSTTGDIYIHETVNKLDFQTMISKLTVWDPTFPDVPTLMEDKKKSSLINYWNKIVKSKNKPGQTQKPINLENTWK